jgi:hypothetical protein
MLTDKETFKDEQLNNVLTPVDQRTVVGYLLLHCMLREERLVINKKHTYRLYTEECLQVRTQRRKKLVRPRMSMAVPELPGDRCQCTLSVTSCPADAAYG